MTRKKTTPKPPPAKESEIQAAILAYLQLKGILAFRMNTGAMQGEHNGKKWFVRFGTPGMSDIIGCYQGRFLAIEVKRIGGKVTDLQLDFLKKVNAAGGIGFVAFSIDDVVENLKQK